MAVDLCDSLLAIWQKHARSPRMASALLKTTDALFMRLAFSASVLSESHTEQLLEMVRGEGRRCSDVGRLSLVAAVLCHLVRCGEAISKSSLQVSTSALP
jgi:hypothetical protein